MRSIYKKLKKEAIKQFGIKHIEEVINYAHMGHVGYINNDFASISVFINNSRGFKNNYYAISPVLAHELGHFIIYKSKTELERNKYNDCLSSCSNIELNCDEKQIILTEEKKAWEIGERVLKELGYKDWKRFNKIKESCLDGYEGGLECYQCG